LQHFVVDFIYVIHYHYIIMKNTNKKRYLLLTRNILIHNLSDAGYNGEDVGRIISLDRGTVSRILDTPKEELLKEYNESIMNMKLQVVDYGE